MAELPEIRLGTQLIYHVAVGDILAGWNALSASIPPAPADVVGNFVTASGITDPTQISAITTLYNDLSASALLDKMQVIYPFVGGNATAHSYNLLDTGSYTLTFNGTWVHDANGVTSNGTNAYASTGYTPLTALGAGVFTTSGSFGLYSRTQGVGGYDMGSSDSGFGGPGKQTALLIKYSNNHFYPGIPVSDLQYSGSNDGDGFYVASRTGTALAGYIDGTQVIQTGSQTPIYDVDYPFLIGAFATNVGGADEFSARNYAFAFIGTGLTATDNNNLYKAVQTYETTLSRQVTPFLPFNTRIAYLDAGDVSSYPGSGSAWTDLDGNHDVALNGTYTYGSTPEGNIDFDGSSGYGAFTPDPSFTDEFTISSWFRMDGASLNTLIGGQQIGSQTAQAKILFYENGDVQFRAEPLGSSVRMDVGFDTGSMLSEWHMLTVKRDASNNIYAMLDDTTWVTGSAGIGGTFTPQLVANNYNTGQFFDGAISNILMYTSSLSDVEVSNIYNHFNPNF